MANGIIKTFGNITGVDFVRNKSRVKPYKSPDMVNMWINYKKEGGECIETREGYRLLVNLKSFFNDVDDKEIYGIHFNTAEDYALIHCGNKLIKWQNFPSAATEIDLTTVFTDMNNRRSSSFMYNEKLYINDGKHYLRDDGKSIREVGDKSKFTDVDEPFVPITTISCIPSGGGESYQDVNVLTPKRKCSFCGDGTSKEYVLDAENIDTNGTIKVWINDALQAASAYTVNRTKASVTFTTAPPKPNTVGMDNVVIQYEKTIAEHQNRINKCHTNIEFDNRIFFFGNPDYKNAIFHSELNNPEYISDLNYYQDGSDSEEITSMIVGANVLWVLKDGREGGNNVFYHSPSIDSEEGKIYPNSQGKVSVGCFGCGVNFQDDIVYLSYEGLKGISLSSADDIKSEQLVCDRSTLVNPKMVNEAKYLEASADEYKGYLVILIDGHMYLANSRSVFRTTSGYEYDWFYFDSIRVKENDEYSNAKIVKVIDRNMFFGTEHGHICMFDEDITNDNGEILHSYYTTVSDVFDHINHLKTTSKRGGLLKLKAVPNSSVKMAVRTNVKKDWKDIAEYKNNGFSFENFQFDNFTFLLNEGENYLVIKNKQKKFSEIQYKIYSNELDKPFGFFSLTIEAFVGGYIKK